MTTIVYRAITSNSGTSSSSSGSTTSRNDTEVTYEEYLEVRNGKSYSEVVAIVGFEGEEMSRNNIAGYESILYTFSNRFGVIIQPPLLFVFDTCRNERVL